MTSASESAFSASFKVAEFLWGVFSTGEVVSVFLFAETFAVKKGTGHRNCPCCKTSKIVWFDSFQKLFLWSVSNNNDNNNTSHLYCACQPKITNHYADIKSASKHSCELGNVLIILSI